jgi:hypothetical protein
MNAMPCFSKKNRLPNTSPATLGVVRGDEPDCPGKCNLLTALIGLQRAPDRPNDRVLKRGTIKGINILREFERKPVAQIEGPNDTAQ